MNEKTSVSKELNAKHAKVLMGLLKLPQNKECADCRSKAPRWASINLGVFICMQCSGIHRSLGVHISKVRSTTLDTWLPEQVAFMQVMGNEKGNEYWEAELPPDYDRNPIEKFIHNKYVEKKWASTTSPQPTPETCLDKLARTSRMGIPKKARKYSLDEEYFTKEILQIAPPTRSRTNSLDMMTDFILPPPVVAEDNISKTDGDRDLFSLLYVSEETDRTVVPPSRWATFEFHHEKYLKAAESCKQRQSVHPNTFCTLILQTKIALFKVFDYTMPSSRPFTTLEQSVKNTV